MVAAACSPRRLLSPARSRTPPPLSRHDVARRLHPLLPRPRPAASSPHHGLAPPLPLPTTASPHCQPRRSSLDRLCRRRPHVPAQIKTRARGACWRRCGSGHLGADRDQCVYVPLVIVAPRAWLPHSLRKGARSSPCSVAPGLQGMDIEDHRRVMEFVPSEILGLCNKHKDGNEKAYLCHIQQPGAFEHTTEEVHDKFTHDSLGFGSAKMIRNPIELTAHVAAKRFSKSSTHTTGIMCRRYSFE